MLRTPCIGAKITSPLEAESLFLSPAHVLIGDRQSEFLQEIQINFGEFSDNADHHS